MIRNDVVLGEEPNATKVCLLSYVATAGLPPNKQHAALEVDLAQSAHRLGYHLEVIRRSSFGRAEVLPDLLRSGGFKGCLIGPMLHADPHDQLDWHGLVVAQCGAGPYNLAMDAVTHDFGQCIYEAAQRSEERGYRRLGAYFVRHDPLAPDDIEHMEAYERAALLLRGRLAFVPIFWAHPYAVEHAVFREWWERHRPDVILIFNPIGYWMCRGIDLQVPEDVGLVTLRRFGEPDTNNEPLSGFLYEFHRLADIAMEWVDWRIRAGTFGSHHQRGEPMERLQVGLHWIEGSTLPERD